MSKFIFLALLLVACSSNKVVIERKSKPIVNLGENIKTIEIGPIVGDVNDSFKMTLADILTKHTKLTVINTQNTNELINNRFMGNRNRQNYQQADLIIKGQVTEEIKTNTNSQGQRTFSVISRPQLQIIKTETGEVVFSKYIVGTSMKGPEWQSPTPLDDVCTDAIISARRMAIFNLIEYFQPGPKFEKIALMEFSDKVKYKKLKDYLEANLYSESKKLCEDLLLNDINPKEKGSITYDLAVVESILGNFKRSKELIKTSYDLSQNKEVLDYLFTIKRFEENSI